MLRDSENTDIHFFLLAMYDILVLSRKYKFSIDHVMSEPRAFPIGK